MKRAEYLSHHWKPYPAMPNEAVAAGRLESTQVFEDLWQFTLLRNGQQRQFQIKPAPAEAGIFVSGDLIAVLPDQEVMLLAPALAPLPERAWQPQLLADWNKFLFHLRDFFRINEFLEVKTPSLVLCPGTEPTLDVFATELEVGSRRQKLFLPTSPEIHLKKALALGAEKIFEIAPCFRNGEITTHHQPEFFMLEWYRAYANLQSIQQDVVYLIEHLALAMTVAAPKKIEIFSIAELFKKYCDFTLTPQSTVEDFKELAQKLGVDVRAAQTIDDYFFLIFLEKIESQFPIDNLIFVEKYPPFQAALARLTEDGWGDRFEVYWRGLELGNAFHELNNPKVQKKRTTQDLEKKRLLGKQEIFSDPEFFQCLEAGMPPSGGIAMGVERLFMVLMELPDISELKVFPYQIPQK